MNVLLWTDGDRGRSASARQWFFQMSDLLRSEDVRVDLNELRASSYDVAVVHWPRREPLEKILAHSPSAHIGVLNPGYLGFPRECVDIPDRDEELANLQEVLQNVDFFVVTSFVWRDLLLGTGRRIYETIDYVCDVKQRPIKNHVIKEGLTIGYHGNERHYAEDFFPHGAAALRGLASRYDFMLKVVTSNAIRQPKIEGVRTEFVEWELESFGKHIQSFDIGICPTFSSLDQLRVPYTAIRNPNRINTLLSYGIPSVGSPVPQSCHDLQHGMSVLFAISEAGWYNALQALITQPDLRNRLGRQGRAIVEQRFSEDAARRSFVEMLEMEHAAPVFPKAGFRRRAATGSELRRAFVAEARSKFKSILRL